MYVQAGVLAVPDCQCLILGNSTVLGVQDSEYKIHGYTILQDCHCITLGHNAGMSGF